jgi:hypothetical protein
MRLQLVTPPATEPVSLADAKQFLRVSHKHDDGMITAQIKAARTLCENTARMSFIEQTWQADYRLPHVDYDAAYHINQKNFDPDRINTGIAFRRGPVKEVKEVKVYLTADAQVAAPDGSWKFDETRQYLQWVRDKFRPVIDTNDFITIQYKAGLSVSDFAAKYADINEAIKICVAAMYDQRGYSKQSVPPLAWQILRQYWSSPTYRGGSFDSTSATAFNVAAAQPLLDIF